MYQLIIFVNHKYGKELYSKTVALSDNKEALNNLISVIKPEMESYSEDFFNYIKEYNYDEKSFDTKIKIDLAKKYEYILEYKLFKLITGKFINFILFSKQKPISFIDFKVDIDFAILKSDIKII